ncbi:MAG: hypothetical protein Q4F49_07780 [Pseudoxanthomonas suwonensis]|nr:hypothetical protein [Pseudoxanthomonas suwonensis]
MGSHCFRLPRTLGATFVLSLPLWGAAVPVHAQDVLAVPENVRNEWGQVLRVDPVYQTLRANRVQEQCTTVRIPREAEEERGIGGRLVDAMREVIGRAEPPQTVEQCREVPVQQEFHRPIAYDVEYVYKGDKYRSRLPHDPGHRIRLRVSVTPLVSQER